MWQYWATFSLSCLAAALAEQYLQRKRKMLFCWYSFLAILIGALLAGVRADSVGTDVLVYGNSVFEYAVLTSNPLQLWTAYQDKIEPLYLLLNYLVSRFTTDVHWFYFLIQFLSLSFLYAALVEMKNRAGIDVWLGLFVYYTTFYAFSLNGMRQAIALSIIIWAFRYLYQKNFRKYCSAVILAMGFHYTAVLSVAFYWLHNWIRLNRRKQLSVVIAMVVLGIAVLFYRQVIGLLAVFVPKYSRYLEVGGGSFSLNPVIVRLPFFLLLLLCDKIYVHKKLNLSFWVLMLYGDMIFSLLRGAMPALYRVSYYFAVMKMEAYPGLLQVFTRKSRWLSQILLMALLLLIWVYQIVLQGNDGVYPYASDVWPWLC